jgi:pilus assembly protein Flp/PilA
MQRKKHMRATWTRSVQDLLVRFARDDSGATAIEYGLIAAMIAVAISATVKSVGANLKTTLTSLATSVK